MASMFSLSCSLDISIVVSESFAGILIFCLLVASFVSSLMVLVLILTYWLHHCSVPRGLDLNLLVAHCSVILIALISNILDTSLFRLPGSLDLDTSIIIVQSPLSLNPNILVTSLFSSPNLLTLNILDTSFFGLPQ